MGKHGAFTGNRLIWLKYRHKHIVKELEMNAKSGWHRTFLVMQRRPSSRHYDLLRGSKKRLSIVGQGKGAKLQDGEKGKGQTLKFSGSYRWEVHLESASLSSPGLLLPPFP